MELENRVICGLEMSNTTTLWLLFDRKEIERHCSKMVKNISELHIA